MSAINHIKSPHRQSGMTLVELMVAMLIGMFLLIGSLTVFTQSRSTHRTADSVARLAENARFALDMLEPDLRLIQFWGRNAEAGLITVPVGINVTCDTDGNTYNAFTVGSLAQPVLVVDDTTGYGAAIPCPAANGAEPNSDALVVRHAGGQVAVPTAGMIQVQTDLGCGTLFNNGVVPGCGGAFAQTHNVVINVYYIDTGSNLDPTLPSLRLKTLVNGGVLQDQEVIAGVENLQVQLGVDTDNDGDVDRYVDGDHALVTPGAAGFVATADIIALRLWMLMRSPEQETGFVDNLVYTPPDNDLVPIVPGGAANPAGNRRLQVSKTVLLRNTRTINP